MSIERIYHTWDKWECYPAGFYETKFKDFEDEECKKMYCEFLASEERFEAALIRVLAEWKNSCEHYLTNDSMNRVAWLGQAAACIALGLPSKYRSGYFMLTHAQRDAANALALRYLNKWLSERGNEAVTMEDAGVNAKVNIY